MASKLWSNNSFAATPHLDGRNESSFKDFNSTAFASQVITASFSMLFYLSVLVLSVLGACFKPFAKLFSSHAIFILFLIGLIMTAINVFTTSMEATIMQATIMLYNRIVSVFLVGVVFVMFGAVLFFTKPSGSRQLTLGQHQPSMGLLLTIITLPLNTTELLILFGAQASKDEMPQTPKHLWLLLMVNDAQFIVQKFIQVAVYVWLRNSRVCDSYRGNAQFYFKVLAFFNFMQWVDAQVNLDKRVHVNRARAVYGEWFKVLYGLYQALLIDYRLLCSLLFLEHSIQVKNETDGAQTAAGGSDEITNRIVMTSSNRQNRNIGYIVGFSCFLAPFICALYYVHKLGLSVYTRAVATFLNSACILACGMVLLLKNQLNFDKRGTESKGVKIMVCCLGAVGFANLMIKAALAEFWAVTQHPYHNYRWAGAELVARGLTTLFLMVLFLQVNARALPLRNPGVKINHFLVPVLMLGIMADFAACLVDQYIGPLDRRIGCEIKEQSLLLLHEAGPAMHLGFLIHVCLHFLIIQTRFGRSRSHASGDLTMLLPPQDEAPTVTDL